MSAHQRILAGSFGFSQPQLLNVSFRSTERQTPYKGMAMSVKVNAAAIKCLAHQGL
ncbi:hypothetical protein WJ434_19160 [Proteus mirabilis]|uniref:hypothetical protein n=1 Tax=Proteus mirabilis TaxID=584 RepID=UPI0030A20E4F